MILGATELLPLSPVCFVTSQSGLYTHPFRLRFTGGEQKAKGQRGPSRRLSRNWAAQPVIGTHAGCAARSRGGVSRWLFLLSPRHSLFRGIPKQGPGPAGLPYPKILGKPGQQFSEPRPKNRQASFQNLASETPSTGPLARKGEGSHKAADPN